jgi:hypothetical protein
LGGVHCSAGPSAWVDPATDMPPNQLETSNRAMMSLNAIMSVSSGCVGFQRRLHGFV